MISSVPLVAFADVNDFAVSSASNAGLMTFNLTDDDYGISLMSSLGTVTNTVSNSDVVVSIKYIDESGRAYWANITPTLENNRFSYSFSVISGRRIDAVYYRLFRDSVPPVGTYELSMDHSSTFGFDYAWFYLYSRRLIDNAEYTEQLDDIGSYVQWSSGDFYLSDVVIDVNSFDYLDIRTRIDDLGITSVAGSFAINFTQSDKEAQFVTAGGNRTESDYQAGVSSSISNISSSVDEMTGEISEVADAIDALRGAMEPHYDNVLTQMHHITEQLHAFWDQLYNMFYLPQYARLGEILDAIQSADSGAVSNLGVLKQTVEKVSNDIQANDKKLSADQIAADDANTEEVKESIEEHGNFIIEGLKGLFIPSDEFFKSYFDDLYDWFSDRFGFLSFPIDLLSRIVDLFVNSSSTDCILTLPSFEISGEQLLQEHSFNLTDFLEENFAFLLSSIRMVSSIGLIMAFVNLCGDKWNEVMRN